MSKTGIAMCSRTIEAGGCVVLAPGLLPGSSMAGGATDAPLVRCICRMLGLAVQSEITDCDFPSVELLVSRALGGSDAAAGARDTCAALATYQTDFPGSADARVLRSDPAYQQIDMNNATLGNPAELALSRDESTALQQTLNTHFKEDGIRFEFVDAGRWYCHFETLPDISTMPVSAAIGRDVAECRPTGADARSWRSRLAEIEMLLFEHPVNTARQERGQLPVNTLWLWGEGSLHAKAQGVAVVSDNFYTSSFADLHGIESVQPDNLKSFDKACLIVTDKLSDLSTQQDVEKYNQTLHWFEQTIASVVWNNLKQGGFTEVIFWCGDNRLFQLQAAAKKKFWRRAWLRPQPLSAFVADANALPTHPPHCLLYTSPSPRDS